MDTLTALDPILTDIRPGSQCQLFLKGDRINVEILDVDDEYVHTTFPTEQYPEQGSDVHLEFHDPEGYNWYPSSVATAPQRGARRLTLKRPRVAHRTQNRSDFRVSTDLSVQVRECNRLRAYDADVLDLSQGGMLIATEAPLEAGSTVEMEMSLPEEANQTALADVVHVCQRYIPQQQRVCGLRFRSTTPDLARGIGTYAQRRLETPTSQHQPWATIQVYDFR